MSNTFIDRIAETLKEPVAVSEDFDQRLARRLEATPRASRFLKPVSALAAAIAGVGILAWWALPQSSQREVLLTIDLPGAASVYVVGDFNDWDRSRTQLARVADGNQWRAKIALAEGVYRYAFLVDGQQWIADPSRPSASDIDFGGQVSVLAID